MDELIKLEQQGWQALATEGNAGRAFYSTVLREDAVMLFPGGLRLSGRDCILDSLGNQPWESFNIEGTQVIQLDSNVATLVYKVTAQRAGQKPYKALISSTYVQEQSWKLALHQHTPR